ncbi:unnamed protein product [Protopolystoma xenopodis]|uniref:Uncharacterized protein n=1 Tax=Protopolystoma xenopodis TaxID=117903 RepID=A0A448XGI5_9PLAT|nr:unnamed protein product [Protopolystoma xenopodis]
MKNISRTAIRQQPAQLHSFSGYLTDCLLPGPVSDVTTINAILPAGSSVSRFNPQLSLWARTLNRSPLWSSSFRTDISSPPTSYSDRLGWLDHLLDVFVAKEAFYQILVFSSSFLEEKPLSDSHLPSPRFCLYPAPTIDIKSRQSSQKEFREVGPCPTSLCSDPFWLLAHLVVHRLRVENRVCSRATREYFGTNSGLEACSNESEEGSWSEADRGYSKAISSASWFPSVGRMALHSLLPFDHKGTTFSAKESHSSFTSSLPENTVTWASRIYHHVGLFAVDLLLAKSANFTDYGSLQASEASLARIEEILERILVDCLILS